MFNLRGEYIAEILPIRWKLPTNQSINQSIKLKTERPLETRQELEISQLKDFFLFKAFNGILVVSSLNK